MSKRITSLVEYPVETPSEIMINFLIDLVRAERWDLTDESRILTFVCLN